MIDKTAATQYPIEELLKKRWSPRAFSDRRVEKEKLQRILEAARWAPSSYNEQPWTFILATKDDPKEFEKVLGCLVDGNQVWAKQAPVLLLTVVSRLFSRNGKPNRACEHDIGLAAANLTFEATALGLYVHQMIGIVPDKVRQTFAVPENYDPLTALAIGYIGDPQTLPENLKKLELEVRDRKKIQEFVFTGGWGRKAPSIAD